jgi:type I restriction enzyme, S subunit
MKTLASPPRSALGLSPSSSADWPLTRLWDEVDLLVGPAFASARFRRNPPGLRLVRGDNLGEGAFEWGDKTRYWPEFTPTLAPYSLAPDDVLVGMDGSKVGLKRAIVRAADLPLLLVQRVARLRASPTLDARFLYYLVSSRAFQQHVDGIKTGTAIPHISAEQIGRFGFPRPGLAEQQSISALLRALDDKIELNRQIAATSHELAHVIFRSRYRSDDPGVPHDRLGEHVAVARGLSYNGAGLAAEGMPLHNLNSIYEGGGYKRAGIKFYRGDYKQRHLVEPGDVVVATVEQGFDELLIGFPAMIPGCFGRTGLFSQDLFRLRPRARSPLSRTFIYLSLLRGRLHEEIAGYANGTTINRIPLEALRKPRFAVPRRKLVEEIDALVMPLFDRAEAAEDESETLAELRDTLLPKLISGELRLRDAEELVESAT